MVGKQQQQQQQKQKNWVKLEATLALTKVDQYCSEIRDNQDTRF